MGLEWTPDLSVDDPLIDRQHRELLERAEHLRTAIDTGQDLDAVEGLLACLTDYVVHHFQQEEEWMERHRYPDIDVHRSAHADMVLRVSRLQTAVEANGPSPEPYPMAMALLRQVSQWRANHIETLDRLAARFVTRERTAA